MKIAVSAQTNAGLDSQVAQHFGRCPYFAIVDLVDNKVRAVKIVDNPYSSHHSPGQVPEFIRSQEAEVMLSGGMGRRAIQFFNESGITAFTGANGTIQTAIEKYLKGEFGEAAPCADSSAHAHGHGHDHGGGHH